MGKEEIIKTLQELKVEIGARFKAEIVGLFGSYVRGEQKENSDLDILVRFFQGATLFDFSGLSDFIEEKLQLKVDIVPIDVVRKEIREGVLRQAIYL